MRRIRFGRFLGWTLGIVAAGAFAHLVGWDLSGWFSSLWSTLKTISVWHIILDCALRTVQTVLTAYAWYAILKFAYPAARWMDVFAGYAVSVALNGILPANLGTAVFLIMLSTTIAAATFAGILGAFAVEKIFFTVAGAFVYLYLFLSVGGSFNIQFDFVNQHPWTVVILLGSGIFLLVGMVRRFWPKVVQWWQQAKEGGGILSKPGRYFGHVFLPSFIAWVCSLAAIGVMLNAYSIPVDFDTLMHVAGGNSLANVTSVTPGGAGINQAFNVASLNHVATVDQSTAFSVASQLINTAWNILLGIVVMVWAWGWTGGKDLVGKSYSEAKRQAEEQRAKRREKKLAEGQA